MASKSSLGVSQAFLRKKFRTGMTFRNYRDREVIFSQGDPADSVFYIESGTVKLTAVTTRKKAIIAILQRGSFFGEGCLAGQSLRICTARSIGCRPFGCNQNSIDCPLFSGNPAFFLTPLDLLIHENTHYSILWRKLQ
jgi:hypothetical protein